MCVRVPFSYLIDVHEQVLQMVDTGEGRNRQVKLEASRRIELGKYAGRRVWIKGDERVV